MKDFELIKSSSISFASWIIPSALNFLIPILIINELGQDVYGIYTLLIAFFGYFTILDLSIELYLIPLIRRSNNPASAISQTRLFFFVLAVFSFVLCFILLEVFKQFNFFSLKDFTHVSFLIFSFFAGTQFFITSGYIIYSGTGFLDKFNKRSLFLNTCFVLIIFLLRSLSILELELIFAIRAIIALLIGQAALPKFARIELDFSKLRIFLNRDLYSFTRLSIISKASSYVSFTFDKFVGSVFLSLSGLGVLAFAAQLGQIIFMAFSKLCVPLIPLASSLIGDSRRLDKIIAPILKLHSLGGFILFCSYFFLGDFLLIIAPNLILEREDFSLFYMYLFGYWLISISGLFSGTLPSLNNMKLNAFSSSIRSLIIIFFGISALILGESFLLGLGIIAGGFWDVAFCYYFFNKFDLRDSKRSFLKYFIVIFILNALFLLSKVDLYNF